MKRLLLLMMLLMSFVGVQAQNSFEVQAGDTSYATYDYNSGSPSMKVYNRLRTSINTRVVKLQWRYLGHSFPANWVPEGFCDNITCLPMSSITGGGWNTTDTIPGSYNDFARSDFHLSFTNVGSNGVAWMRVEVKDPAVANSNRILTFIAAKSPLGITTTVREENISVYPNPARESINIVFDKVDRIKTVGVYNLLGQPVSMFHIVGSSANLPLGDAPAGVYFLRMFDAKGQVLATRRFTRM